MVCALLVHLQPDSPYREQDEIPDDNTHAPQRKEVVVPVPGLIDRRFEAAQEGVVHEGGGGIVQWCAEVQNIVAAQ